MTCNTTNQNTYKEKYDKLMEFRKQNPFPVDTYGENHHIVPKSIDPSLKNDPANIVRLSASEHFKAHYWLFMFYKEIGNIGNMRKMCYALHRMKAQIFAHITEDELERCSMLYEQAMLHKPPRPPVSDETRRKMSEARKGKYIRTPARERATQALGHRKRSEQERAMFSQRCREQKKWVGENNPKYGNGDSVRGERNPMWGRHRTEEEKRHLSECRSRPVAVYKDGVLIAMYKSVRDTEKALGIYHIGSRITGVKSNNTPYVFKHVDKEEFAKWESAEGN